MPVDDHPVHAKVKHDFIVAGCFDLGPAADGLWLRDGYIVKDDPSTGEKVALPKMVWVPARWDGDGKCRQIGVRQNGEWKHLDECDLNGRPCKRLRDEEYIDKSRDMIDRETERMMALK